MHGSLRDVDAADDHGQSALQSAVSSYGNASAKQQGDWTTGYERARDRQGEL
jgi:VCBS repeat-containing protein